MIYPPLLLSGKEKKQKQTFSSVYITLLLRIFLEEQLKQQLLCPHIIIYQ